MKRAIFAFCAVVILVFCMGAYADTTNLLSNGGFESVTTSNLPHDWYATAYRNQPGYSRMTATDEMAHSGRYSVLIENASANDARFTFTAKVEPESLYRLSGYVFVEHMEDTGNGANFGIEGVYSFSDCIFDTNGEWRYLEWYGETGEKQTEITIGVRVGGYSAESTGKAYFDDIVLEKVDSLPQDIIASLWYKDSSTVSAPADDIAADSQKSTVLFLILGVLFLVFFTVARPALQSAGNKRMHVVIFSAVMVLSVMLRVILAIRVPGYEVDINCFTAWSLRMANVGPVRFYAPDYFCDYPPGAMLLLWPVGMLLKSTGLHNRAVVLLIVKLLPVLCDMLGGFILFFYAKKRTSTACAATLASLYLLNPAALVNGAAWGQMDSVLALFILLTAFAAIERKWTMAIPCFILSLLVKPQALLFAPLGGIALLRDIYKRCNERKKVLRETVVGIGFALVAATVIVLPFAIGQDKPLFWIFSLYSSTIGSYAYATLNTANIYFLVGANWAQLSQPVSQWLIVPAALFFGVCTALLFCKAIHRKLAIRTVKAYSLAVLSGIMTLSTAIMAFLNVDYSCFGYSLMAFVYLFAIICFCFEQRASSLLYYMAMALCGIYVLGLKVHERYLFPALLLLLASYVTSRDKRILWLTIGFSITTFINTAIVLDNCILFGAAKGHLNTDTTALNIALCIANIALYVFSGFIGCTGLRESKLLEVGEKMAAEERVSSYRNMLLSPGSHQLNLTLRDYLIIGVTTLLYACLAFANLGSTAAPQTAWVSTSSDETVVLELEEPTTFSVLYYAGVSYNDFAISVSEDGVNWSESYPCEMREGLCYRWNYAVVTTTKDGELSYPSASPSNVLWLTGKYLRVHANETGLNLWEVVARDKNGANLPLTLVSQSNAAPQVLAETKPAANLIDEMNTCVGDPSWYNGTYFDEIYHARTAYEHLHGQPPYETTHPPLGKLLMSAAIAVFGMTPFGWRFAGTLIGVLMVPVLYLLALQLTHKRSVALLAMLGITFDLMHFTQTRIATIDSFPVFFIMLTYLFMIRYMQMDSFAVSTQPKLLDKSYLKTLVPLGFCGLFMGMSIASKWIGIYSAAGLALLFFMTMYRQLRAWDTAWKMDDETIDADSSARILAARNYTVQRVVVTCCFCLVFFILIPIIIYCVCYIPYLSPTGPVTLKRIWRAQLGMFNYHSTPGLGMDHPFQSPWWQWPFILKPMWFCRDMFEPAGTGSTIMCFGNPWIFYIGAFAMIGVLCLTFLKYFRLEEGKLGVRWGDGELTYIIISIGFLAQYLPWVLVPRSMYIYHYFASVPFIILATAVLIDKLTKKRPQLHLAAVCIYLVGAVAFFIMFFPYASGYLTSVEWLDAMKWFSKLYY